MKKKNIGSSFDSWLDEEGIRQEVTAGVIKRVLARQTAAAMAQEGLTKTEMARRMQTSRSALNRLLDAENESITLATLQKVATAMGREVRLELRTRSSCMPNGCVFLTGCRPNAGCGVGLRLG